MNSPPQTVCGVLLVDKPVGPTSFRIVQQVRRATGVKKVGHAGTLDPFASGLLIVCVSRSATKQIDSFMQGDKEYVATLQLGVETSTLDPEGEVTARHEVPSLSAAALEEVLAAFRGELLQAPPQFSAVKHKGKPLYHYARKGVEIKKEPRPITIHELELLEQQQDRLQLRVVCSKGTYIRVLAADIGTALGCGAHLTSLRRTASGLFRVEESVDGNLLTTPAAPALVAANLLAVEECLARGQD
ncbi:MAG: tRNA pseudouridine(55) synthase TruB [Thermodesulfobacteriota bacterium]